jgi:hypothetical protein
MLLVCRNVLLAGFAMRFQGGNKNLHSDSDNLGLTNLANEQGRKAALKAHGCENYGVVALIKSRFCPE